MTQIETNEEHDRSSGFKIPWNTLAVGLGTITAASLGTLVVVASVQNVDALSTVALALAVLAFAAQLVVSLAQASAGAQQIAQAERINAATQSALADLRATSQSQLVNQKEIFSQVLRAALPEVAQEISEDAVSSGGDTREFDAAAIEVILESAINRALANYGATPAVDPFRPLVSQDIRNVEKAWHRLTLREKSVAKLAGEGEPNGRISKKLGIAPATVSVHLSKIFRKMGVKSRMELAVVMASLDITDHENSEE